MIVFFLLLLPSLFLIRFLYINILSYDSFTHLALGKYIVTTLRIPAHSDISYKSVEPAMEFIVHSWISDVLFYITHSVSTTWGPYVLLLSLLVIVLYVLREILSSLSLGKYHIVLSLSIASFGAAAFWRIHPLIFIPLLSLITIWGFISYKSGSKIILFTTPFVFFVWANIAGGYIIILGLLYLSFILFELITLFWYKQKTHFFILISSFLLGIAASLLNPQGIRIWIYALTIVALMGAHKWPSTLIGAITLLNQNYVKSPPTPLFYTFYLVYLLVFFFLLGSVLVKRFQNVVPYLYLLAPALVGFFSAYQWVRLIPFAFFVSLPLFGIIGELWISLISKKARLLLGVVVIGTLQILFLITLSNIPHISPQALPVGQVQIAKKYNLSPNYLTTQEYTGYIYYSFLPQKVMMDAQDDLFDDNEILTFFSTPPVVPQKTLDAIIKDNDITTAITSRDLNYLGTAIQAQQDWLLLYFDENGYIFVKKDSVSTVFTDKYALTHIYLNSNLGFDKNDAQATIDELNRFLKLYSDNQLALGQLATIYRVQKQFEKAEQTLSRMPLHSRDLSYFVEMGRLKAAQGLCKTSEEWYLKALTMRKEQLYSQAVLDLAVLYGGCFQDKVKAKHYFARYNSFVLPPNERERVRQLAEQFEIQLVDE